MSLCTAQAVSSAPPLYCPDKADCEYVRLSEILINTPKPYDQRQVAAARQEVEMLRERLRRGESFANLAKTHSRGPSAVFGGDVGYFGRGKLSKSMEDVAFQMRVGDISDIIRTKQGFVILEVTDRGSEIPPLDLVNAAITSELRPYLETVRAKIQQKWNASIPASAQWRTGTVTVGFVILSDGNSCVLGNRIDLWRCGFKRGSVGRSPRRRSFFFDSWGEKG